MGIDYVIRRIVEVNEHGHTDSEKIQRVSTEAGSR
jgi:hypothetical protein